jgi:zinc transport system substrate-binding protein
MKKVVLGVIFIATILYFTTTEVLASSNSTPVTRGNTSAISSTTISSSSSPTIAEKVRVVASFYPIFEFVKKVGGDRVEATSLIPVGTEPHDFDPTVQQVRNAETADMVVLNGAGFEGEQLMNLNAKFVVDTSKGLNLTTGADGHTEDSVQDNEFSFDPHVWLDPLLAKQQVEQIRDGLVQIDPRYAEYYNKNANSFMAEQNAGIGYLDKVNENVENLRLG